VATPLILARWPQIIDRVPELIEEPGDLLYVGANKDRFHYGIDLYRAGNRLTVLEIWPPYIDEIKHKEMIHNIVCGDVREADRLVLGHHMFDYTVWWHGPEHLDYEDIPDALWRLERITRRVVILGSPWGRYPQGTVHGNPYEAHRSALMPDDFQQWGYETATLGEPHVIDSNILAWRRLKYTRRRRSRSARKSTTAR